MAAGDTREALLEFLDEHMFEPVLTAEAEDFSENQRKRFTKVRRATQQAKERYYKYESAESVVQAFEKDLSSDKEAETQQELGILGLPTLAGIADKFRKYARELGAA